MKYTIRNYKAEWFKSAIKVIHIALFCAIIIMTAPLETTAQATDFSVVVGDVNSSDNTSFGPVNNGLLGVNLIPYRSEVLVTADEIGLSSPGNLQTIDFFLTGGLLDVGLLSGANIYIKEVGSTSLSSGSFNANPTIDGYTFIGDSFDLLTLSLLGNQAVARVTLGTPFSYSGTQSLSIRVVQTGLLGVGLLGRDFKTTDVSPDRFKRSNTFLGIPVNTVEAVDGRPVTRLNFEIDEDPSLSNSTIIAAPTSIAADGSSTSTITVQLRDDSDDVFTESGGTVALNTSAGSLSAVTDNGDGTYTATLTSPTNIGSATVTGTLNGSPFVDTAIVTFIAGAASGANSTIAADPNQLDADGTSTSTITVTLRDAFNNPITTGGDNVLLSTGLGSLGSVTDNGDGTYTAIYTAPLSTGSATISGTVNSEAMPSAVILIGAGAGSATTTTIEASPSSIIANGSSTSTITVTVRDGANNPVATGGEAISLMADDGSIGSVTDNGDGTYTAVFTSSTTAGTATITGILNGDAIVDDEEIDLIAGPPTGNNSSLAVDPATLVADGVSTSNVTITLRDQFNNIVNGSHTVVGSTGLGTLGSFTLQGDGTYTATYTSSTSVGVATINSSVNGQNISPANITLIAGSVSIANSSISANPSTLTADGLSISTVTLTARDANNNPVTSGITVVINTDNGVVSSVTNAGNGNYVADYTASTSAGIANITTLIDGNPGPSTSITLDAAVASGANSSITVDPNTLPGDGTSTSTVTVTLNDENGNPITGGGDAVVLNTDLGTLGPVTDNGDGTYTAEYTAPNSTGTATITGTVNGEDLPEATIVIGSDIASTATTTIDASPTSLVADGMSTSTITVTLRDAGGNLVGSGGPAIVLMASAGTLGAVTDNGDGTYTAEYTSSTSTMNSPVVISGTLNGSAITDTAEITLTAGPASGANSSISVNPSMLPNDGTSTAVVTVTLRDANDNPIVDGGDTVVLSTDLGTLGPVTDNGDGTYTAEYTAPTTTGIATIAGTVNGENMPDATIEIVDDSNMVDPETSTITAFPILIPADGVSHSIITVDLRNASGQSVGVGGHTVTLSTTLGTLSDVEDLEDGRYRALLFSATTAGSAQVTAVVNGIALNDDAIVDFEDASTESEDPVIQATIMLADPMAISADGISTSTVLIWLMNSSGEPIIDGDHNVSLNTTEGEISDVIRNADGSYQAILTSSNTAGTAVVSGTINGQSASSLNITFYDTDDKSGIPSALATTISADPIEIPADGESTSQITVVIRDYNGDLVIEPQDQLTLATSSGEIDEYVYQGNGMYSATLTSASTASVAIITGTINGIPIEDDAGVWFTSTGGGGPVTEFFSISGSVFADHNGSETWDFMDEEGVVGVLVSISGKDANENDFQSVTTTESDGSYTFEDIPIGFYEIAANIAATQSQSQPSRIGVWSSTAPHYIKIMETMHVGTTHSSNPVVSDSLPGWVSRVPLGTDNLFVSAVFQLDRNMDGVADGSISMSGTINVERNELLTGGGSAQIDAQVTALNMYGTDDLGNPVTLQLNGDTQDVMFVQSLSSTDAELEWSAMLTLSIDEAEYTTSEELTISGTPSQFPMSQTKLMAEGSVLTGSSGSISVLSAQFITSYGPDFGYYYADYGSAPMSYGTLIRDDGARHIVKTEGPRFGSTVHSSSNGQTSDMQSDHDGVTLPDNLVVGQSTEVDIDVQIGGYVNAWIDFDNNGTFDANERISENVWMDAGAQVIEFTTPLWSNASETYARFRISSDEYESPKGIAIDGEVEDYMIEVVGTPNTITGRVYDDNNVNGMFDDSDEVIADVVVYVDLNDNGVRDQGEIMSTTDSDGMYRLELDNAGSIKVMVEDADDIGVSAHTHIVALSDGDFISGIDFIATMTSSDDDWVEQPVDFKLYQNYPNPFNPSTIISFELAESKQVTLTVHDITGRTVATLISSPMLAGKHSVQFNATHLASGIYIYRINAGAFKQTMKMTLIK